MMRRHSGFKSYPKREKGVVLIIVALAMVVLLGTAGLALDGAHTMISKTRMQNSVDAAALSSAKTLDETRGDVAAARTEALAMFTDNLGGLGNNELQRSYDSNEMTVSVEFSNTLLPFVPGSTPALYVRVTATNLVLDSWLIPVMGIQDTTVSASAVSGPSTSLGRICNIAPMMVCAGPNPQLDPFAADYDPFFGFTDNNIEVLKAGSPNQSMEQGNFQLIRLEDSQGGADARDALAGSYDACITSDDPIQTEPGNTVGPVAQGFNTRLGRYDGPMSSSQDQYPPDQIITQPSTRLELASDGETILFDNAPVTQGSDIDYSYADYTADIADSTVAKELGGVSGRRVIAMPVGVCGDEAGQSEIPFATVLCFYLIQEVNQGNDPDVFGQFTGNGCRVTGTAGPVPTNGPGPYVIQLYKDASNVES
jgi:Flp pilus assembly protein TadG